MTDDFCADFLGAFAVVTRADRFLMVGNDRQIMGGHANGRIARTLGWLYFGILCVLAVAAPVLFIATNGGG